MSAATGPRPGALVISLDFELAWGVRDSIGDDGPYRANLLGAREAIPRILDLFVRYGIAATWATVGFLFAESRDELEAFSPAERPAYADPRRDPYRAILGANERDDPLHFAPSLIRSIASSPKQEIGSHTFSHYYCLDPGQTVATFEADLNAAMRIAAAKGWTLRSLVLPRHQVRADYLPAIARSGLWVHRSNEANRLSRPRPSGGDPLWTRALRLIDAYVPLTTTTSVPWATTAPDEHGLVDVRESRFLRPVPTHLRDLEPLRLGRIVQAMERAARSRSIVHLWWHPHNFGVRADDNLATLETVLQAFARLRDEYGFESLGMGDVAEIARRSVVEDEVRRTASLDPTKGEPNVRASSLR